MPDQRSAGHQHFPGPKSRRCSSVATGPPTSDGVHRSPSQSIDVLDPCFDLGRRHWDSRTASTHRTDRRSVHVRPQVRCVFTRRKRVWPRARRRAKAESPRLVFTRHRERERESSHLRAAVGLAHLRCVSKAKARRQSATFSQALIAALRPTTSSCKEAWVTKVPRGLGLAMWPPWGAQNITKPYRP